jgi:hypothetical protein
MPKAILIKDNEFERDYQIRNGRIITLTYDDSYHTITFSENGKTIGDEFAFKDEQENGKRYLLKRMYSPVPYSGLGRAAIEFFIEMTGASIYCRRPDGIVRDDSSHLTESALFFVSKMQIEKLIENWKNEDAIHDEDDFDN